MNISQRLRTCAKHTALDAVIELLNEAADEIDRRDTISKVNSDWHHCPGQEGDAMSTKAWWRWEGTPQFEHGRATYFCGTVNEVSVSMPHFAQAHALANAIEAQAKATRHDARYGLLQEIGRIEP